MKLRGLLFGLVSGALAIATLHPSRSATTLLPNGEQCFQTATGPVSSGSINMYFPGTTTPKTTWQDAGQVSPNTQPIQLDANGCAIIYGVGTYRQQLFSGPVVGGLTTGNLIFDLNTTDTSAFNSTFWAGRAGGTPNIITIVDTGFNATDGSVINFTANATNTGSTTINPSGFGVISVVKDTTAGPVSLIGGEIIQNNTVSVVYRATDNQFHILNPVTQSSAGSSAPLCGAVGYSVVNTGGNPNTQLTVAANTAVMVSGAGNVINRSSVSVNINTAVVGANGLDTGSLAASSIYYVYLIDNGSAPAGLMSLSSTAPTLPAGYTFLCRLSADYTDSSVHLGQIVTEGTRTQVAPATALPATFKNGTIQGTCFTTFTALTFALLPPTAERVVGILDMGTTTPTKAAIASSTSGTNILAGGSQDTREFLYFSAPITTAQTLNYCSDATGNSLQIQGWDDNTNAH